MSGLGFARRAVLVLVACLATLASAAACGSSSPGNSPGNSPGSSAGTSPGRSPGATGGSPDAEAEAAIRNAYEKFFSPDTPEEVSLGLLQDGQAFKAAIEAQAKGSMASQSSVKVSKVTMQSAKVAKVVFTILLSGNPVLPDQPGYAVKIDGTWKVAGTTFCALLTLQGSAPPACQTPEATALPTG